MLESTVAPLPAQRGMRSGPRSSALLLLHASSPSRALWRECRSTSRGLRFCSMISRHSGARSFRGFNPSTPCSESSLGRVLLTGPCLCTAAQELPQRTRRTLPAPLSLRTTQHVPATFVVVNFTKSLIRTSVTTLCRAAARNPL